MKKPIVVLVCLFVSYLFAVDSLQVNGRVTVDSLGLPDVQFADVKSDANGYFSFTIPAGSDTSFTPHLNHFLFEPAELTIHAQDTVLDSINIVASRQKKKTIIVSGQSNATQIGQSKFFIQDSVDQHIPYFCATTGTEYGLSTLGLLTNFNASNLPNFGFENLLGRTLYKQYCDSLAVVKIAWGGTSLYSNWQEDGATWQWFLEKFERAKNLMLDQGYEMDYIGLFWWQGESDRSLDASAAYSDNLNDLVDRFRAEIPNGSSVDSLPFVCVRILWNPENMYEETVRQAQMAITTHRSETAWIDIDDCDPYRLSSDNLHYNGNALNRIGYKLAAAYLDLVGHPVDSSATVTLDFKGKIDSGMTVEVSGDRTDVSDVSSSSQISASVGDSLHIRPVPGDDYVFEPAEISIPFVYDPSAILDGTYSFDINYILKVQGRVKLDSCGLEGVQIGDEVTDSSGYYSFELLGGKDTTITPVYKNFIFDPPAIVIDAEDTFLDSMNFTAKRQVKKVIVISGQSNAEHVGEPHRHFIPDAVDNHIPYYLAYSGGEFGLSTLGLLTKFGYSYDYCKTYNHGFGLEMLLARTLYKHYSDSLAVFKAPYSGTSLYENWQPDGATWQWFIEKQEHAELAFREEGYEPEYIGVFWFQGESDETPLASSRYAKNLRHLVDRMRDRFENFSAVDSLPFICVQINWNHSSDYEAPVRAAQMALPTWRGYTACVDVDDCNPYRYTSKNMHFNGNALNRIGYKLAVEYLDMVGEPIDSNITVSVDLDEVVDTTVILTVTGDINFTHVMDSLRFDFPATLGDDLELTLNLGSEVYNYSPAMQNIPFAYDQSALKDPTYTFNVNKVVGIEDYPDDMDHLLMNCYPNPFNPATAITFHLPETGDVKLAIYDISGRKVRTLLDRSMDKGSYDLTWNAQAFPSGVYVVRLQAGGETVTNKMVLMK
jgi:hypothetical protein